MEKPIAAIELGSKKLKLVVGYELNGKAHVRYTLVKPYGEQIIEGGNFLDFNKIISIINELISFVDPSVKIKINITDVVLALPPYGLEVMKTKQTTGTTNEEGKITTFDIKNLYSIIRNCNNNASRDALVDIVPHTFVLDQGRNFMNAPVGEVSRTLQVVANVHTLPQHIVHDYQMVIQNGHLNVKRSIVSTFAASELIATDPAYPANYFLVDIGSSTTTVGLVGNKMLFASRDFQWGGDNITQKIVACFNINEADAEKYKITYGIDKRIMNFKAPVCVTSDGEGNEIKHYIDELNSIIKSELDIFVSQLDAAIMSLANFANTNPRMIPIILTGGGSRLHGLVDYILPKVQPDNVMTFVPKTLGARNATFTNCLGMILVCSKYPTAFDETHQKVGNLDRESVFSSNDR